MLLALAGCGGGEMSRGEPRPALRPELRIQGDAPGAEFTWIAAIAVAEDGTMYTLHPAESTVRIWGADGRLEGSFGAAGEGPGQLLHAEDIGWMRDSIWVSDPAGGRFNVYDREGRFARALRPGAPRPGPSSFPLRPVAPLPDGSVLAATSWPAAVEAEGRGGARQVVRLTGDGAVVDTVASFPATPTVLAVRDPDAQDSVALYTFQPYPDAPLFQISQADSTLVVVRREVPAVARESVSVEVLGLRLFRDDTVFARTIRYPAPVADSAAVGAFVHTWAERAMHSNGPRPATIGQAERWVRAGLRLPAVPPAVTALGTGMDGSIWLLRGSDKEQRSARVISRDGRDLWTLQLPTDVRLLAADTSCVWGTYADSADVPWLIRYRIRR